MPRATNTDTATALGQSMLAARQHLGLTQLEAAKRSRIDSNVWARYERGEREIPMSRIRQIEQALGVRIAVSSATPQEEPEQASGLSAEGRRVLLAAARRLQALAQEMQDEALATTPLHVPASAAGVRDVLRQSKLGQKSRQSA